MPCRAKRWRRPLNNRAILLTISVCSCLAQPYPSQSATAFVFDGNRIYAKLSFVRPDGSGHEALAFVDMGSPRMTVSESLFRELRLDRKKSLAFRVGELLVEVPAAEVDSEPGEGYSVGSEAKVEATLAAGVLEKYQVIIDYAGRKLTLAQRGSIRPQGIATPFHLNVGTALIAVDAMIAGKPYAITIDCGSAYTWFRQSAVKEWLASHPQWERGVGAVGASNMMMAEGEAEASGVLARIPEITIGPLVLRNVGVLGPAAGPGILKNLFDWYSNKNALPVLGWVGGNVLKHYRLTIDYSSRTLYWLKQGEPDVHDLDQIGLTLRFEHGNYIVAGIATKNGNPTVKNVEPGDKLMRIGVLDTNTATWGKIYAAMHGKPGEIRRLVVERDGTQRTIEAEVTGF